MMMMMEEKKNIQHNFFFQTLKDHGNTHFNEEQEREIKTYFSHRAKFFFITLYSVGFVWKWRDVDELYSIARLFGKIYNVFTAQIALPKCMKNVR